MKLRTEKDIKRYLTEAIKKSLLTEDFDPSTDVAKALQILNHKRGLDWNEAQVRVAPAGSGLIVLSDDDWEAFLVYPQGNVEDADFEKAWHKVEKYEMLQGTHKNSLAQKNARRVPPSNSKGSTLKNGVERKGKPVKEGLTLMAPMTAIGGGIMGSSSLSEVSESDSNPDYDAAVQFAHVIQDYIESNIDEFANAFVYEADDRKYPARTEDIDEMANAVAKIVVRQLNVEELVKKIVSYTYKTALGG